jgi:hypothetical protein
MSLSKHRQIIKSRYSLFTEKPKDKRQDNADNDTCCNRKVEIEIPPLYNYVARQLANKRYLVSYNENKSNYRQ